MTVRTEVANGLEYTFNPEPAPPVANRLRAVVRARMLDELTGLPMTSRLIVTTPQSHLRPRVAHGGIAGLAGNPARTFPSLGGLAADVDMSVNADRYLPRQLSATLGPVAGFPNAFAAHDFGDVPMHRAATRIRGRAVRVNGLNRVPLDGADVRITGIWPTFPPADADAEALLQPANIVSMTAGLYAGRTAGIDQFRRRVLGIVLGEEKILLERSNAGQRRLRISDRVNLNPGDLLAIDPNHAELAEYIVITAVDGASSDDQPATITLNYPLQHNHLRNITVVRATLQLQAADNAVDRPGIPDDQTLFGDALNGLVSGSIIEIIGSGDPEYHVMRLYRTIADADGYFRLPPLARVAQLRLQVDHPDLGQPHTLDYSPDYDLAGQRIDIVVP